MRVGVGRQSLSRKRSHSPVAVRAPRLRAAAAPGRGHASTCSGRPQEAKRGTVSRGNERLSTMMISFGQRRGENTSRHAASRRSVPCLLLWTGTTKETSERSRCRGACPWPSRTGLIAKELRNVIPFLLVCLPLSRVESKASHHKQSACLRSSPAQVRLLCRRAVCRTDGSEKRQIKRKAKEVFLIVNAHLMAQRDRVVPARQPEPRSNKGRVDASGRFPCLPCVIGKKRLGIVSGTVW